MYDPDGAQITIPLSSATTAQVTAAIDQIRIKQGLAPLTTYLPAPPPPPAPPAEPEVPEVIRALAGGWVRPAVAAADGQFNIPRLGGGPDRRGA